MAWEGILRTNIAWISDTKNDCTKCRKSDQGGKKDIEVCRLRIVEGLDTMLLCASRYIATFSLFEVAKFLHFCFSSPYGRVAQEQIKR